MTPTLNLLPKRSSPSFYWKKRMMVWWHIPSLPDMDREEARDLYHKMMRAVATACKEVLINKTGQDLSTFHANNIYITVDLAVRFMERIKELLDNDPRILIKWRMRQDGR